MSEQAGPGTPAGSAKLFVRQSSGLVRNVSATSAPFSWRLRVGDRTCWYELPDEAGVRG